MGKNLKSKVSTSLTCKKCNKNLPKAPLSFKFAKTNDECLVVKAKRKENCHHCDNKFFFGKKKTPKCNFASATIATPVDLMNGTTMNTSRVPYYSHTDLDTEKSCTPKTSSRTNTLKDIISEHKILFKN